MKRTMRKLFCLLLAALLTTAAAALAEAADTQNTGYLVTGYRYANGADGQLTLYDDQLAPIGAVANGARLTLTNGEKDGYVYVRFGTVSGWVLADELSLEEPEEEVTENSPTLTPIQTDPPAAEDSKPDAEAPSGEENGTEPEADTLPGDFPSDEEAADDDTTDDDTTDDDISDSSLPDAEDPSGEESGTEPEADTLPGDSLFDVEAADDDTVYNDTSDSSPSDAAPSTGDDTNEATAAITYENTHAPMEALYTHEDGSTETVQVVLLGVITSLLDTDEGIQPVDTAKLTFAEDMDEARKLGYVHAPRTGQAGLREEASKSSKVITQLKAGQLVAVLALDGEFAHVNVQGQEGWLRLDCLRYLEPAEEGVVSTSGKAADKKATAEEAPDASDGENETAAAEEEKDVLITANEQPARRPHFPSRALLSCQQQTDGETSVNLRNLPTKESAKTAVWRTGEAVTVLSDVGGWYLVEANGTCGYVMEAFLTFEE